MNRDANEKKGNLAACFVALIRRLCTCCESEKDRKMTKPNMTIAPPSMHTQAHTHTHIHTGSIILLLFLLLLSSPLFSFLFGCLVNTNPHLLCFSSFFFSLLSSFFSLSFPPAPFSTVHPVSHPSSSVYSLSFHISPVTIQLQKHQTNNQQ